VKWFVVNVGINNDKEMKTNPLAKGITDDNHILQLSDDRMKPVSTMTGEEIRREKFSIWKNVSVISLSFMCLFTAFFSVSNLQVIRYQS